MLLIKGVNKTVIEVSDTGAYTIVKQHVKIDGCFDGVFYGKKVDAISAECADRFIKGKL